MITLILSNFFFLLFGITVGYFIQKNKVTEAYTMTTEGVKRLIYKPRLGGVKRPSAQDIQERGTVIAETKAAMTETLQNDPYFNETNRH